MDDFKRVVVESFVGGSPVVNHHHGELSSTRPLGKRWRRITTYNQQQLKGREFSVRLAIRSSCMRVRRNLGELSDTRSQIAGCVNSRIVHVLEDDYDR